MSSEVWNGRRTGTVPVTVTVTVTVAIQGETNYGRDERGLTNYTTGIRSNSCRTVTYIYIYIGGAVIRTFHSEKSVYIYIYIYIPAN